MIKLIFNVFGSFFLKAATNTRPKRDAAKSNSKSNDKKTSDNTYGSTFILFKKVFNNELIL